MVNGFLIAVAVVVPIVIVAVNLYILVYFQHEEDKNTAIFPKIVVITGLTLTCLNVLLLPFDVANARSDGGFPMQTIWLVFYVIVAVMIVVILPFSIFYYEAEDPDSSNSKQIKTAIMYEFATVIIFTIIAVVMWIAIGIAEVPVDELTSNLTELTDYSDVTAAMVWKNSTEIKYRVSFILYIISVLTFVGMFLFVIFGAIGLAALPMDLINAFRKRPRFIDLKTYIERKIEIGIRAQALAAAGRKLNDKMAKNPGGRPKGRAQNREFNKFRAAVFVLEEDYKKTERAYGGGVGPRILQIIWDYTQLVLGVISIVLSICWLLHIILYMTAKPPIHPFLNNFFIALDEAWAIFGVLAYGIFAFYYMWCIIKGNFKFGLRIPLLFSIHPMKVGETLMNAFLFNTLLLLLASMTLVQFCSDAFSLYNRFTGIDSLFNIGVRHLIGIKYVWYYYFWAILGFAVLGLIYLCLFPSDRKQTQKGLVDVKTNLPK
eukprot:TRINITY_DN3485_c0_g1_i1.p1 TRINITY_DN3485_c0_g1~~TRINITY_DN3485_c0_g1_i1.p1  ORF type:complete len:488 (-),score=119.73 TRINITY_DN3485_c0_g1_i1:108-1571(-)